MESWSPTSPENHRQREYLLQYLHHSLTQTVNEVSYKKTVTSKGVKGAYERRGFEWKTNTFRHVLIEAEAPLDTEKLGEREVELLFQKATTHKDNPTKSIGNVLRSILSEGVKYWNRNQSLRYALESEQTKQHWEVMQVTVKHEVASIEQWQLEQVKQDNLYHKVKEYRYQFLAYLFYATAYSSKITEAKEQIVQEYTTKLEKAKENLEIRTRVHRWQIYDPEKGPNEYPPRFVVVYPQTSAHKLKKLKEEIEKWNAETDVKITDLKNHRRSVEQWLDEVDKYWNSWLDFKESNGLFGASDFWSNKISQEPLEVKQEQQPKTHFLRPESSSSPYKVHFAPSPKELQQPIVEMCKMQFGEVVVVQQGDNHMFLTFASSEGAKKAVQQHKFKVNQQVAYCNHALYGWKAYVEKERAKKKPKPTVPSSQPLRRQATNKENQAANLPLNFPHKY